MTIGAFRSQEYWEALLHGDVGLAEVGYPYLPRSFNAWLYRAMAVATTRALSRAGVAPCQDGQDVLDVGAGTGFWIDFWLSRGANSVTGFDLTGATVDRLRSRFPGQTFEQLDIAEPELTVVRSFDLVSAMSVLLHVTDEARFEQALENLGRLVRPGGHLVVIDPIRLHPWWGAAFTERSNSRAWPLALWCDALRSAKFEIVALEPVTALLSEPVDCRTRAGFAALDAYWRALARAMYKRERTAHVLGAAVYTLDRLVLRVRSGPSSKCLVARALP